MYLKSLTLKGFKSFASATTLNFEPGITAVVGPNGSGKSNVVDAIAWVLGEQGAKALRGGKMEDVIFAGTAGRQPLGRAEVTLTIDNTDGALPIEYSRVEITRRMFRDGAGEYEINGASCRLLDIQELLSDSGIGREMHVIVGQGQLDAVLSARPEDRRAFIEEAAGVLKHRKRKEKALRKLDAMQINLTRLGDLTAELRRQLKPLGRQADVARRAMTIQADLRDTRLRLLADDVVTLQQQISAEAAEEQAAVDHRERVQRELAEADTEAELTGRRLASATPELEAAHQRWFALSSLSERFRGTIDLSRERARNLGAPQLQQAPGRDPAELEAAAEIADAEQAEHDRNLQIAAVAQATATAARSRTESDLRDAERELLAASRAIADRREGLATLNGRVAAARSRLTGTADEITRLTAAVDDARQREAVARGEFAQSEGSVGSLGDDEVDLDTDHESASAAAERAADRVRALLEEARELRSEQTSVQSRIDALGLALNRRDGTAGLLNRADGDAEILGPVSELLTVRPGAEVAIAAALGPAVDAVAVSGLSVAAEALDWLRASDGGRVGMIVGQGDDSTASASFAAEDSATAGIDRAALPPGAFAAIDAVTAAEPVRLAVAARLQHCVVVSDVTAARELLARHPHLTAITVDGEVLGATWAVGGRAGAQSSLELQAATDAAAARMEEITSRLAALEAVISGARAEAAARQVSAEATLQALHDSDARLNALAEQLGRLAEAARSAAAEAQRLDRQRQSAEESRSGQHLALIELEARLVAAESTDAPTSVDTRRRDTLLDETARARETETQARLALRTAEERARATAGRGENLRRAARTEREARQRAEAARRRRVVAAAVAERVADRAELAARLLAEALQSAGESRDRATAARAAAENGAAAARRRLSELTAEWEALTSRVHRDELLRAQQQVRLEQLVDRSATEFALSLEELVRDFGPAVSSPPSAGEMAEYELARSRGETVTAPTPMRFDRASTERRLRAAERDLTLLGKVNPLALEEFAALEERHAFLSTQLADLKDTRRDLLTVVGDVDRKIEEVFRSAFDDVAREFVVVFGTLFPGGEGELVLTNPDDMLSTGIEVHARPPGKKVKRLSLLSGGERSLTAVAILVAIFRARPSPFYVMDEVEAALDEVNLTRLVSLLAELRESSQLIIITHQKFTMEAADALYGVSMRGDGITQVISQRIRGLVETSP